MITKTRRNDRLAIGAQQPSEPAKAILPAAGFMRLPQIIGDSRTNPPTPPLIPVSRSTWLEGVRTRRYPQPVRTLGKRITAWRTEDIIALIDELSGYKNTKGGDSNGNR